MSHADSLAAAKAKPKMKPPRAKQYWRRWSPEPLQPVNLHAPSASIGSPPQAFPGSGTVLFDMQGHLLALESIPPDGPDSLATHPVNWAAVLEASGRDPAHVSSAPPPAGFVAHADSVRAWRLSDSTAAETTLVAAALGSHVVRVETFAGRNALGRLAVKSDDAKPTVQDWVGILFFLVVPMVGSIILARRNLRSKRGDVRGALVVGISIVISYLLSHLFSTNGGEVGLYSILLNFSDGMPLGHALVHGVAMALSYLAIEPYVRRLWPSVLVSWARLVSGRLKDPIIGRDILVGAALGAGLQLFTLAIKILERGVGLSTDPARLSEDMLSTMTSAPQIMAQVSFALAIALLRATELYTLLVIFRFILRNNKLAIGATLLFFLLIGLDFGSKAVWVEGVSGLVATSVFLSIALRYGYVATIIAWFVGGLADSLAWSLDFSGWVAPQTMFAWGIVAVVVGYGFMAAVGGKTLFSDPLSDPIRSEVRPKR